MFSDDMIFPVYFYPCICYTDLLAIFMYINIVFIISTNINIAIFAMFTVYKLMLKSIINVQKYKTKAFFKHVLQIMK